MINLPIGDIIRDSFKLAWRHKYLWLFGLFAGGNVGMNFPGGGGESPPDPEAISAWLMAALAMIIVFGLIFLIIFVILHVISKTALIYNVYQIETGGAHGISGGWDFAKQRFWPMLGLTILQGIVMVGMFGGMVFIATMIFLASTALGFLSLMFILPIGLLLLVIVVLTWTYAERFVVLETLSPFPAIGEGWSLVKLEWRPSALMLLAKFAIAVGAAIVFWGIGVVIALPAIAFWATAKPLAIIYGILVLTPLFLLATCYFGAFGSAAWTKVFLALRSKEYSAWSSVAQPSPPEPPPAPSPEHD